MIDKERFFINPSCQLDYLHKVQEHTREIFKDTEFDFFIYVRGDENGSLSSLFSNVDFAFDLMRTGYPHEIKIETKNKPFQSFSYIWNEKFPSELLACLNENYNIYNGVSLVKRYRSYFETFGFGISNQQISDCVSIYINSLPQLDNFTNYFVRAAKNLINSSKENPFMRASSSNAQKLAEFVLPPMNDVYSISGPLGDTILTAQEFLALQKFIRGKSYKEIGKIMEISPRTVEKYLRNTKKKISCHVKDIKFISIAGKKVYLNRLR